MKLENLRANAAVRGVPADSLVTVVGVQWFGSETLELTWKAPDGKVANELLYGDDESRLEIVEVGRPFDSAHQASPKERRSELELAGLGRGPDDRPPRRE